MAEPSALMVSPQVVQQSASDRTAPQPQMVLPCTEPLGLVAEISRMLVFSPQVVQQSTLVSQPVLPQLLQAAFHTPQWVRLQLMHILPLLSIAKRLRTNSV